MPKLIPKFICEIYMWFQLWSAVSILLNLPVYQIDVIKNLSQPFTKINFNLSIEECKPAAKFTLAFNYFIFRDVTISTQYATFI